MYIVQIEGSDPFIAESEGAIYRGLDDLEDGETIDTYKNDNGVRILYQNNIGDLLNIVATKTELYK